MAQPSIHSLFPQLTPHQQHQLSTYAQLLETANQRINLISRKDIANLTLHHILPSLSPLKTGRFEGTEAILDVGTGGGLPGIPLAIAWPEASVTLLDAALRKVRVLQEIVAALALANVQVIHQRIEHHKSRYDAVIGRAVMDFRKFVILTRKNLRAAPASPAAGWWYFSGGDLSEYRRQWGERLTIYPLHSWIAHPYFDTKALMHLRQ